MGVQENRKNSRRSTRVAYSIPVEVSGCDVEGREIHEKTTSKLVNKHGACISVRHKFSVGSEVVVSVPHMERQQRCRVAWVSGENRDGSICQIGVELERAENFWGVHFPPEDWGDPKPVPHAGDSAGHPALQSGVTVYDLRGLSSIVNALVSVLEEKGVLSKTEVADMLKRISFNSSGNGRLSEDL